MATEATASPRYAPQLDGLRAVAVSAVAYSHWLPGWQGGVPFGAGVHLFFVLSGFLITRILLDLRTTAAKGPAVGRFFARRALRLFPAFYVVLAAAWLADVPLARATWPWHASYLSNVYIAGVGAWQGHFSHFWSLAVEEQFYLVWPWLVVWLPAPALAPLFAGTTLVGPLSHLIAASYGLSEPFWALVPGGSADSLGLGALVAWSGWRRDGDLDWRRAGVAGAVAWTGLALADLAGGAPVALATCRQLAQGLVFAWVVWRASRGFPGAVGRLLAQRAVVALGRISYGVYLVHAFAPLVVIALVRAIGAPGVEIWPPALGAVVSAVASVTLAVGLWIVVERPAHRLKARLRDA